MTLPLKMFGTVLIVHSLSSALSRPEHATALPGEMMCTSPCGCEKPRPRPGTIGTRSCLLLMCVKSATCQAEHEYPAERQA